MTDGKEELSIAWRTLMTDENQGRATSPVPLVAPAEALRLADALTDEQWREIQEALPKVGESENLWVCVRGGTLRALAFECLSEDEFERGRRQGMKQERALWKLAASSQEIEAAAPAAGDPQGELDGGAPDAMKEATP